MKTSENVLNNPNSFSIFLSAEYRPPETVPQHRHPVEYEWFFCREGGGVQVIGDWQQEVTPGQLLLIPPGESHVFCGSRRQGCQCEVMMLSPEYFDRHSAAGIEGLRLLEYLSCRVAEQGYVLNLPPESAGRGAAIIRKIRQLDFHHFGASLTLSLLVGELLLLAADFRNHPPPRPVASLPTPVNNPRISALLYHLDQHFAEPVTVAEAVRMTGLPRSTFHWQFRKMTGTTFGRYLNRVRLLAVENLVAQGMKTEEAARQCGFFSRGNYYYRRRSEQED